MINKKYVLRITFSGCLREVFLDEKD